jgi:hypothetical protein
LYCGTTRRPIEKVAILWVAREVYDKDWVSLRYLFDDFWIFSMTGHGILVWFFWGTLI